MPSKHSAYGNGSRALRCRSCGRSRDEVEYMSARALCGDCGARRDRENAQQLIEQSGPYYDEWRKRVIEHARRLEASPS